MNLTSEKIVICGVDQLDNPELFFSDIEVVIKSVPMKDSVEFSKTVVCFYLF